MFLRAPLCGCSASSCGSLPVLFVPVCVVETKVFSRLCIGTVPLFSKPPDLPPPRSSAHMYTLWVSVGGGLGRARTMCVCVSVNDGGGGVGGGREPLSLVVISFSCGQCVCTYIWFNLQAHMWCVSLLRRSF